MLFIFKAHIISCTWKYVHVVLQTFSRLSIPEHAATLPYILLLQPFLNFSYLPVNAYLFPVQWNFVSFGIVVCLAQILYVLLVLVPLYCNTRTHLPSTVCGWSRSASVCAHRSQWRSVDGPLCLTAECLCLFPVPDNSSMQRGCPPGPTRGHQSSARRGQTLWKCPEHCEAPGPRLSHPVVYQLSAATQRPVLLLTTLQWTKSKLRNSF